MLNQSAWKIFFFYYRGFFVKTTAGQEFEFAGAKAKQAVEIFRSHLKPEQIRRRKRVSLNVKVSLLCGVERTVSMKTINLIVVASW